MRQLVRTCDDDLCFKVGLFQPLDSIGELWQSVSQQSLPSPGWQLSNTSE